MTMKTVQLTEAQRTFLFKVVSTGGCGYPCVVTNLMLSLQKLGLLKFESGLPGYAYATQAGVDLRLQLRA